MKTMKKERLSEMAAKEIKAYMKERHLKEGDKLPPVSELMETLGIGRSTLREALQLLESRGALQVLNGKGTFVKDIKPFHIQTSIEIDNKKDFLLEALEVRKALEGKAVDLAVVHASDTEVNRMQTHLNRYVEALKNNEREKANAADADFHQTIYQATKNELLKSIIDSVWDSFYEFWNEPFGVEDIFDTSYPYHETLLQAIKERDSEKAAAAFQQIMESVRSSIENI
ncbi:FadR/GntR family transcriptional regulator [Salibacterium aidingense]|uniref:FadR/GntR family transcriptional regulator n=1 Tax=Salibacterium aidingense TaxID=384933 RepID=UPI0004042295|nr:FadR/GntR family transcriptional regulator [Salibacterium aidingense]